MGIAISIAVGILVAVTLGALIAGGLLTDGVKTVAGKKHRH